MSTLIFTGNGVFQSCMYETELPELGTSEVTDIKPQSATFNGIITDYGGGVDLTGFCWGTLDNTTVDDFKIYCGH